MQCQDVSARSKKQIGCVVAASSMLENVDKSPIFWNRSLHVIGPEGAD
jgi:hypothetical protein